MTTPDKENSGTWDSLLTDSEEAKDDETYIQPNIELKLSKQKRQDCRDILLEIKKFGVSQRQMLYLVYLLALELEDQTTMKALVKVVGENRENVSLSALDTSVKQTSAIVIPEGLTGDKT